jgi:signal transduction histidine kinase
VHNEGVNIPAGEIDRLFRPFSRLPGSGSQKGSGLGLYIAKCIIEAHGGELRLEQPSGEHQGATFTFDLPV